MAGRRDPHRRDTRPWPKGPPVAGADEEAETVALPTAVRRRLHVVALTSFRRVTPLRPIGLGLVTVATARVDAFRTDVGPRLGLSGRPSEVVQAEGPGVLDRTPATVDEAAVADGPAPAVAASP